jgi:hypothetical protein
MTHIYGGAAAIVGAAATEQLGRIPDRPTMSFHAEPRMRARCDASLTPADVDVVAQRDTRDVRGTRSRPPVASRGHRTHHMTRLEHS